MASPLTRFAILLLSVVPSLAYAGDLKPRAEVNFRAGTERSILMTEFWAPLAQQSDRVLYADLRLMGDGDDNREGNLGVGYRQISNRTNSVLGANAWIDRRRTERGNHFHQLTLGVESLGDTIDLRANGYIQLNDSQSTVTPNSGSTTPYLAGSGIFIDTNGLIVEEPQDGFDAEIGYRLPILQKHIDATRVYAGGYHFFGDTTDNVTGFRLRTEAQINSIFSVGARFQHDGPRGSQGFLEATLRFPFKSKKLYQEHGLRSRLDESPERDIDIVTGTKVVDSGLMKPVLNASGTQQRILYVDNTNAAIGDGTKENPFNTLAAAQTALQENDILYVNRGDGTTTGMHQGLLIEKNNIQLIGSGSALTYAGFTLLEAGLAPVITNTATNGDAVYFHNVNAAISGITVSNAVRDGIRVYVDGTSVNDVSITNVTATGNTGRGIMVLVNNGGSINATSITNSIASGSTGGSSGDFVTGIRGRGLEVGAFTNSAMGSVIVDNITANSNSIEGLVVQAQTSSSINDVRVTNNSTLTNGGISTASSFVIQSISAATINQALIQNNTVFGSVGTGINISALGGSINKIDIITNTSNNNASNGFLVQINAAGSIGFANVLNLTTHNNGFRGVYVANSSTISTLGSISLNSVTANNNLIGIHFHSDLNVINSAVLNNITANNNTQYGLHFLANPAAAVITNVSVSNSTFTGNGLNGVYLRKVSPTGILNVDFGGGAYGSTGNNRIFGNVGNDLNIDRVSNVAAGSNWWNNGGAAPTRVTLTNGASAIYTPPLTTDPRP